MFLIFAVAAVTSCTEDTTTAEGGDTTEDDTTQEESQGNDDSTEVSGADAWVSFYNDEDNILLDFSYAGYERGEEPIPDVSTLGYDTFNITDYGAVADDGASDLAALVAAATAIKAKGGGILYIPEGTFDIHNESDDLVSGVSESTIITTGNIILKGAGRDLTTLRMSAPMQPTDPSILYSSPVAIYIKHNSDGVELTNIASTTPKGNHSIWVESTSGISVGDWVVLKLTDNSPELVEQRLGSEYYTDINSSFDISVNGVQVVEYHQVKGISGKRVEFYEPVMHDIDDQWAWKLYTYPHYEGVGVEDITFEGFAQEGYVHHGSWEEDGAYKPINLMRLTNSWMRRVRFLNVSEASSIIYSANISIQDIIIEGNRGHSAIRSQCSSRVFMGKVTDRTTSGAGQFHGVGVSKPAIGTVLWRNEWGSDSCFESHANQPRATLIDMCRGAFVEYHQGGDLNQGPSHMEDLTMWNFEATSASGTSPFKWWDSSSGWRFLPPIVVGFHGASITFDTSQMQHEESTSKAVYPESLYEAQLEKRLGALPSWVSELKSVTH